MGKLTEQRFFKGRSPNGQKHMKKCSTSFVIKEMQIKTRLRVHLISVRIVTIKNTTTNKCWPGCEEKGTFRNCW
jgi:hypothetical protein